VAATVGAHLWSRDADGLARRAAELESYGFASLTVGDHLHPGAIGPLTACAIIAGATTRARLGPLVLNNDFRHPVVLAREAAALADLSRGRFELGLGAGYAQREYERAGIPFSPRRVRIARLSESARILRGLLAGETVDVVGAHYEVRGESVPVSQSVPILIGGNSPELHDVAAEHGDILSLAGSVVGRDGGSDYAASAVERQLRRLGDSRPDVHVLVQWHEVTANRHAAAERAAAGVDAPLEIVLDSPYVLVGTAEEIAEQLHRDNERFGITRWTIFADRPDLQAAEALLPVLELLGQR
jgi:probable F420-dependent oxidoreductase